jgi:hypothetical protein
MEFEEELLAFKPFERSNELYIWLATSDEICLIEGKDQLASHKVEF